MSKSELKILIKLSWGDEKWHDAYKSFRKWMYLEVLDLVAEVVVIFLHWGIVICGKVDNSVIGGISGERIDWNKRYSQLQKGFYLLLEPLYRR